MHCQNISDLTRGDVDSYCLLKTNVRWYSDYEFRFLCRMNRQTCSLAPTRNGKTQITFWSLTTTTIKNLVLKITFSNTIRQTIKIFWAKLDGAVTGIIFFSFSIRNFADENMNQTELYKRHCKGCI